ncbi:hypothetical protein ACFFGT_04130 [Mucilaginibacter angelicae]|uniref:Lipoprotein n=1 Tax=Mucilaginibacter angelicae TaxID=869718 RepID=A0ABV6L1X3_9SPHI
MKKALFILLVFASCRSNDKKKEHLSPGLHKTHTVDLSYILDYRKILSDTVKMHKVDDISIFDDTLRLSQWLAKSLASPIISASDLAIKSTGKCLIRTFGKVTYFNFFIKGDKSSGINKNLCLLLNRDSREIVALPFENFKIITTAKNAQGEDPSGFINIRSQDFFSVYKYENGVFLKVFDSSLYCKYGIYTGEYNGECLEFTPNQLIFSNEDVNKDGFNDIVFHGSIYDRCDEAKMKHRGTVSRKSMTLQFLFNPGEKRWDLAGKDDACAILDR